MHVFEKLDPLLSPLMPCVLTVGSFDGVHLGHQMLLGKMREIGEDGTVGILTFANHPSYVLEHLKPVPLILSKELKIKALEEAGMDVVYCLEFTKEVAALSYEAFLRRVRQAYPFNHLVLGEGAALGHKREGNSVRLKKLGEEMGFIAHYLSKLGNDSQEISSGRIRTSILAGDLKGARAMLGRPFQIGAENVQGEWQVPLCQCLPPNGTYQVVVEGTLNCELKIHNRGLNLNIEPADPKILITFE